MVAVVTSSDGPLGRQRERRRVVLPILACLVPQRLLVWRASASASARLASLVRTISLAPLVSPVSCSTTCFIVVIMYQPSVYPHVPSPEAQQPQITATLQGVPSMYATGLMPAEVSTSTSSDMPSTRCCC